VATPKGQKERTFLMIKPDGVQRGLIGKIIQRFEKRGFKMVAMDMRQPPKAHFEKHYAEHKGKPFFEPLTNRMVGGPVCAMVWEGDHVIAMSRKMLGATDPADAAIGTIRGDLA
jgi:nucleoside-diphosphate kinase